MQQIQQIGQALTPEYFTPFGKLANSKLPSGKILKGLVRKNNANDHLLNLFSIILAGNHHSVNQMDIDNTACSTMQNGIENFQKILITAIDLHTKKFCASVQSDLDKDEYSNGKFINQYNSYIKNASMLRMSLKLMSDYLRLDSNKNMLNVYLNYIFYSNVINHQYKYKNNNLYLYEVMMKHNKSANVQEFFTLFKLFNYQVGFSYSLKDKRSEYFNIKLDTAFSDSENSTSVEFNNLVVTNIDINIRNLSKFRDDVKQMQTNIKLIQDYIKMCLKFNDKTLFIVNYVTCLCKRLKEKVTNCVVEKEFISSFRFKDEPELYVKMTYCVEDITMSEFITKCIREMDEIEFKSEAWKNVDKTKLNKNICDYTLVRPYAWMGINYDSSLKYGQINLPPELAFYGVLGRSILNDPNGTFSQEFTERSICEDYDNSTVVLEAEFGGKLYLFNMTLLQAAVFTTINNNNKITASSLEAVVGTPLKNLSAILNSLIKSKLIVREKTESNDTNMGFTVNEKYSSADEKICLVSELEKIKNGLTQKPPAPVVQQTQQNPEKIQLAKNQLLSHFVKTQGSLTIEQLEKFSLTNKLEISTNELKGMLDRLVATQMISLNNLAYEYIRQVEQSESEEDVEEGSEEGSVEGVEEGSEEEAEEEAVEGSEEEAEEEAVEGSEEGSEEEVEEGSEEGAEEGSEEEVEEGSEEGAEEGSEEGAEEGSEEGAEEGSEEGSEEGAEEGAEEGSEYELNDIEKIIQNTSKQEPEINKLESSVVNQTDNLINKVVATTSVAAIAVSDISGSESEEEVRASTIQIKSTLVSYFKKGNFSNMSGIKNYLKDIKVNALHSDVKKVLDELLSDDIIKMSGKNYVYNNNNSDDESESVRSESEPEPESESEKSEDSVKKRILERVKKIGTPVVSMPSKGTVPIKKRPVVRSYHEKEDLDTGIKPKSLYQKKK